MAAGAFGTAAAGSGKLLYDTNRLTNHISAFSKATEGERQRLRPYFSGNVSQGVVDPVTGVKAPLSLEEALGVVEKYNTAAHQAASSRILGIPAGHGYMFGRMYAPAAGAAALEMKRIIPDALKADQPRQTFMQELEDALEKFKGIYGEEFKHPAGYGRHMQLYTDPKMPLWRLNNHSLVQALGRDQFNALPGSIRNYIDNNPTPLAEKIKFLEGGGLGLGDKGIELGKYIRMGLLGGPQHLSNHNQVGLALNMIGDGVHVVGQGAAYEKGILPVLRRVRGLAHGGILAGSAGLAAATLPSLWNRYQQGKQASQRVVDSQPNYAEQGVGALMMGAGLPSAPAVIKPLFRPNRQIGITYGSMTGQFGGPEITAGHRNPGQAIREILEEAQSRTGTQPFKTPYVPGAEKFTLMPDIVRGAGGLLNTPEASPNILIETGFGATMRPGEGSPHVPKYLGVQEKIRPQHVFSYLTDNLPDSLRQYAAGGATASVNPLDIGKAPRTMLTYGNNAEGWKQQLAALADVKNPTPDQKWQALAAPKNFQHLGDVAPAIKREGLEAATRQVDKGTLLDELSQHFARGGQTDLSAQLQGLKNRRFVVASGSTRGDYVAQKARDWVEALKAEGINDVDVVAQMGHSFNDPLQRQILAGTNVIQMPGMPLKHYVGLQSIADAHDASSGASAKVEAMLQPSPATFSPNYGLFGGEPIVPGTPAARMRENMWQPFKQQLAQESGAVPQDLDLLFSHLQGFPKLHEAEEFSKRLAHGHIDEVRDPNLLRSIYGWGGPEGKISPNAFLGALPQSPVRDAMQRVSGLAPEKRQGLAKNLYDFVTTGGERITPNADWNEGNIDDALKQKGVFPTDDLRATARRLFGNPETAAAARGAAGTRATETLGKLLESRSNLAKTIFAKGVENVRTARILGGLRSAGGLTAAAGGAALLWNGMGKSHTLQPPPPPPTIPPMSNTPFLDFFTGHHKAAVAAPYGYAAQHGYGYGGYGYGGYGGPLGKVNEFLNKLPGSGKQKALMALFGLGAGGAGLAYAAHNKGQGQDPQQAGQAMMDANRLPPGMSLKEWAEHHPEWKGGLTGPDTRNPHPEQGGLPPSFAQSVREIPFSVRAALPAALGAGVGGLGALLGGDNPLRGAGTGIGTGLGFTAGGMLGNAGAQAMGVQDPAMRALLQLGGAGVGAYAGNRIAGSLVGNKRRRSDDEA